MFLKINRSPVTPLTTCRQTIETAHPPAAIRNHNMANTKTALLLIFASLLHIVTNVNAIVGNEASILACSTGPNSNCGIWATYTNTQTRQTASRTSYFAVPCALMLSSGPSNSAGFWAKPTLFGSDAGWHIGYTPTG